MMKTVSLLLMLLLVSFIPRVTLANKDLPEQTYLQIYESNRLLGDILKLNEYINIADLLTLNGTPVNYSQISSLFENKVIEWHWWNAPFSEQKFTSGGAHIIRGFTGEGNVHDYISGVSIHFGDVLWGITVDYKVAQNYTRIHYHGINGFSSRNDVLDLLGEPLIVATNFWPSYLSYMYQSDKTQFVRFFFNEDDTVIKIEHFTSLRSTMHNDLYLQPIENLKKFDLLFLTDLKSSEHLITSDLLDLFSEPAILRTDRSADNNFYLFPNYGIAIRPIRPALYVPINAVSANFLSNEKRNSKFHLQGIDGTKYRKDVVNSFGFPDASFVGFLNNWHQNATMRYVYILESDRSMTFFFNAHDQVVAVEVSIFLR